MSAASLLMLLALGPVEQPISFDAEIVPLITRSGCNAGACHGAAAGRGGFRLSLFGSDPAADYHAMVRELEGRRVNLFKPSESLLLQKPSGRLSHGGDVVLAPGQWGEQLLLSWIQQGARRIAPKSLVAFRIEPTRLEAAAVGDKFPLLALAQFEGGEEHDVTRFTLFRSVDPASLEMVGEGDAAVVRRPGQHVLTARFLDRAVAVLVTLPLGAEPVDLSSEPRANFIDEHVYRRLTELRLPVSPKAEPAEFCRRVYLDLTGRLPTPEQQAAYLVDDSPVRRERLIDRLLASEEFAEFQAFQLATLLGVRSLPNEPQTAETYHGWLRNEIAAGTSLAKIARELLLATGDTHENGPANFTRLAGDARTQAEQVGKLFLGAQLQCANCHNHPLDRWTQDDFHGLAAVFAKLERGRVVQLAARGAVTNPRTGEPAELRIPGVRMLAARRDPREEFAAWLLEDGNHRFARATVNRLWKNLFGRGLVEPVDDLRATNPATHPELLDELAEDFLAHGCDLRHTLRLIAGSDAYARSGRPLAESAADDCFYSHFPGKPLAPEVFADAIADVLGIPASYPGRAAGTRAVQFVDQAAAIPSLDVLGRCGRSDSCNPSKQGGGLAGTLHRLNGSFINERLASEVSRLQKLLRAGKTNEQIVNEFYLRALCREPAEEERAYWAAQLTADGEGERREQLEDFVWSLLNSPEFTRNH